MRFLKLLFFIFAMMVGAAFTVLNAEPVLFNYYFGSRELPLSVILMGALGLGVFLGILSGLNTMLGLKRKNSILRRRSRLVDEEVKNLRSLPLKDQ
ncbi:MAG: LapA family protein [Chromatiales bacterium]|nr:LapA family protein [Gammaproteobacteria bacterium]